MQKKVNTPEKPPTHHELVCPYYAVVIYFFFKNKVTLASSPFQEPGEGETRPKLKKTPVLHWFDFLARELVGSDGASASNGEKERGMETIKLS